MKRLLYIIITTALTIFSINSCDMKEKIESLPEQEPSEILSELQSFNDSLIISKPETKATVKEIMSIVTADLGGAYAGGKVGVKIGTKIGAILGNPITGGVFGAFIGGVGFGAYASWLESPSTTNYNSQMDYSIITDAYTKYCLGDNNIIDLLNMESEETKSKIIVDSSITKNVKLNNDALEVGLQHNVLLASFEGELNIDEGINTKAVSTTQNNLTGTIEEQVLYSKDMEDAFNELYISNNINKSFEQEIPDIIVEMYIDIISNYASECKDIVFVINKYSECIQKSNELTDQEKNSLYMGLATSLYSFNYWTK